MVYYTKLILVRIRGFLQGFFTNRQSGVEAGGEFLRDDEIAVVEQGLGVQAGNIVDLRDLRTAVGCAQPVAVNGHDHALKINKYFDTNSVSDRNAAFSSGKKAESIMRRLVADRLLGWGERFPLFPVFDIRQLCLRLVEPRLYRRDFLALEIEHIAQILDLLFLMRKDHLHLFYRVVVHGRKLTGPDLPSERPKIRLIRRF